MSRRKQLFRAFTLYNPYRKKKPYSFKGYRREIIQAMTPWNPSPEDEEKRLRTLLVNAGIMAGLGFFKFLISLGLAGQIVGKVIIQDPLTYFLSAGIVAGFDGFSYLALARWLPLRDVGSS